ncbi:MAG: gliding motility-associated protein GldE [Saprospiraceae bacterium]|nr:gliding motility-associated protein GldE [Saprospiraceae bacterium]
MDTEPPSSILHFCFIATFVLFNSGVLFSFLFLALLILSSALISGSEIAFFSLSPTDMSKLAEDDSTSSKRIISLKEKPRTLLATILIANNLVNIAIVVVSDYLIKILIGPQREKEIGEWLFDMGLGFLGSVNSLANGFNLFITVVVVTFILVLFGEIAPKLYANLNNMKFARFMAGPLMVLNTIFGPFSRILVRWSNKIENKIMHTNNYQSNTSREDLDAAIDLTVNSDDESSEEEADILKGIVKFGDVSTKQIMKTRVDVTAIDISTTFEEVMEVIKESGFSRIPVFDDDFDSIVGILYVKDLIGLYNEKKDFDWSKKIRTAVLYVPESKKIDDLLKEFQIKRTHIAIVVDEYGGSSGIVTLEDVMEEVIGDIKDEFDEVEDVEYVQLTDNNYIFEGKSLLNDVCRIIGVDTDYFDKMKGESDSLAGLIIEMLGAIPKVETEIEYEEVTLKIISVSRKRIEKVHLSKK